jgi:phospholipid/cholesterol/gamma-HCH transport system substrate-binding protein
MENRAHAIAAGLFAIVLGLAIAGTAWWLSGQREFTRDYVLVTRGNVTGLNPQAQVRYRGIRAGKVVSIELDPADGRDILVTIQIGGHIPITAGTRAQLNFQGVTGLAYVQLTDDGESRELLVERDGRPPRIALMPSELELLADDAKRILGMARSSIGRINTLLDDDNLRHVAGTLRNMESAAAGIDRIAGEIPGLLADAKRFLAEANAERLGRILANVERVSGEGAPLVSESRLLVASLQSLTTRLERVSMEVGSELAGTTLPRTNELLQELTRSSRQLRRLLDHLEAEPQAVVFGRGASRPGPGEAGFEPVRQ